MLHEKIKHLREWRNYTQEYMAHAMGISQNVYSKIENGHQKISIERLRLIAIALGVTLEILICEDPLLNKIYNGEERRGEERRGEERRGEERRGASEDTYNLQELVAYLLKENERLTSIIEGLTKV